MKRPSTRAEFERNLHLLHHKEQLGQFKVASHLSHALEGLDRLRPLPNGRMDFLSVDDSARMQANMLANMMNFEPEKPAEGGNQPDVASKDESTPREPPPATVS